MRLVWTLACSMLLLPAAARPADQVTFQANGTLYRIAVTQGALPDDLSALLDAVATEPGTHAGPITVSPDGDWYVLHSGRFAPSCANTNACLTIAPASLASAETILLGASAIHGDGGIALPGGDAVVYADGGGPHAQDLFLVRKQGNVWTAPTLLTAASTFARNRAPRLSAGGTRVIFDAGDGGSPSTAIAEVGVDGAGFQVLVTIQEGPSGTLVHSGARARDGRLVFEADWSPTGTSAGQVWRQETEGPPFAPVNETFDADHSPCVLPDGRIASLYQNAPDANSGLNEVKIMGADGLDDFLLTSNGFIPGFVEVDDIGLGCGPAPGSSAVADVGVTQHDAPDPTSTGTNVTYALAVRNAGPEDANGVVLTDTLPTGAQFVSVSPGPPICVHGALDVTCGLGVLAADTTTTVLVTVLPTSGGTLLNGATLASNSTDPNPQDDSALEKTTVFGMPLGELVHGSVEIRNLASVPGQPPTEGIFRLSEAPTSSYEIVVDGTGGGIGNGSGPRLDLVDDNGTVKSSISIGAGGSRSLRFENRFLVPLDDQWIRVGSNGCTTDCGPGSVYRIRAYDTTYGVSRFNNSGTQVTILVLRNGGSTFVSGIASFWDTAGAFVGNFSFALGARQVAAINTAVRIGPGTSGSITLSHDGPYGSLTGKAVAVEPATGFTFDTPLLPRPR